MIERFVGPQIRLILFSVRFHDSAIVRHRQMTEGLWINSVHNNLLFDGWCHSAPNAHYTSEYEPTQVPASRDFANTAGPDDWYVRAPIVSAIL